MSFEPSHVKTATAQVASTLSAIEWITDARIERLSQDFYWFSPVLKRQLEHLRADAVARPKTEEEIRAVVAACAAAPSASAGSFVRTGDLNIPRAEAISVLLGSPATVAGALLVASSVLVSL